MPEQQPPELTFNQYAVLIQTINSLREELRTSNQAFREELQRNNEQTLDMLRDHEERLRRNEVMVIIGFFIFVLAVVIVFFIIREVPHG